MTCLQWQISGSDSKPIYGNTHLPPQGAGVQGSLVISHGLMGYKDYGFIPYLAKRIAEQNNLLVHRFNFSHSGVSNNYSRFEFPELFAEDNWGRQVEDIICVDAAIRCGDLPKNPEGCPVYWLGHSRGGVSTLLAASRTDQPPSGVITAAAPSYAMKLDQEIIDEAKSVGYFEMMSGRTGQVLKVNRQWIDAIENDAQGFCPLKAIGSLTCPVLLVHGEDDPTVPVCCAKALEGAAEQTSPRLHLIPGCNHVFNTPNPLAQSDEISPELEELVSAVSGFVSGG